MISCKFDFFNVFGCYRVDIFTVSTPLKSLAGRGRRRGHRPAVLRRGLVASFQGLD